MWLGSQIRGIFGSCLFSSSELAYAGVVKAFYRSKPEAEFGVDRILYHDRYIHAFQGIGYLLDEERIYCCSRPYP
jgi:hypothetical protein